MWFTVDWWWFPVHGNPQAIGEINPTTHQITEFPIPDLHFPPPNDRYPEDSPWGIAAGADGNLWFAEQSDGPPIEEPGAIGELGPANSVVSGVTVSPDGTVHVHVTLAFQGRLDVLVTAWKDNIATRDSVAASAAPVRLEPAPGRFAFGRSWSLVSTAGSAELGVKPDARGLELVRHPHYPLRLRVWVTYTPTGGTPETIGYYGLKIGGRCPTVASTVGRLKVHCV
jgi:hypothetical protein